MLETACTWTSEKYPIPKRPQEGPDGDASSESDGHLTENVEHQVHHRGDRRGLSELLQHTARSAQIRNMRNRERR